MARTTKLADLDNFAVHTSAGSFPKSSGDTDYNITVLSYIGIKSVGRYSLNWYFSNLMRLQELGSLCSGRYLHLLSLDVRINLSDNSIQNEPAKEVTIYARTHFPLSSASQGNVPPVISVPELLAAAPAALSNWYSSYEIMAPSMNLLFTVIGAENMFVNVRFLLAVQSLEVFHRRTSEMTVLSSGEFGSLLDELIGAIPSDMPTAMKEKLRSLYQYANEPSLMQRMRDLLGQLSLLTGEIPAGFSGDFSKKIVATRNYNTHFNEALRARCYDAAGMHWATRRIVLLLTVLFLKRLGVDPATWPELLVRHREFLQLWQSADAPS
jgi:hypothetical protein